MRSSTRTVPHFILREQMLPRLTRASIWGVGLVDGLVSLSPLFGVYQPVS